MIDLSCTKHEYENIRDMLNTISGNLIQILWLSSSKNSYEIEPPTILQYAEMSMLSTLKTPIRIIAKFTDKRGRWWTYNEMDTWPMATCISKKLVWFFRVSDVAQSFEQEVFNIAKKTIFNSTQFDSQNNRE